MSQRYTYDSSRSTAGLAGWDGFLGRVLDVESTVAENSTARLQGVGQWIWPATIGAVALVAFLILRKKGR